MEGGKTLVWLTRCYVADQCGAAMLCALRHTVSTGAPEALCSVMFESLSGLLQSQVTIGAMLCSVKYAVSEPLDIDVVIVE